ncbi:MAG: amidase family protein, partial [Chloroflexota bacterium]
MNSDLCFKSATELARLVRNKEITAVELMEAHLRQIEAINPTVNAFVTLVAEQAIDGAKAADDRQAMGKSLGPLHGLPVAHKDLTDTKGIKTTYGSPLFSEHVPTEDALIVERLKSGGAITLGKTNTPEFGAGSQTFNSVFGATVNPYNTDYTCGGSSGGAAVALACGMTPLADGSDMGGSLRNPASFCNVVGLRPSPGRVPTWPKSLGWGTLGVVGPMARTVEDIALMLQAIAGPDPREPIAIQQSGGIFAQPLERDFRGVKVAWSRDLGYFPVDSRVTAVLESQRATFSDLGCDIEETQPDFTDADETFKAWRAYSFESGFGELTTKYPDKFKQSIIWNVDQGRVLTGPQLSRLEMKRTMLYHRLREFMETY